MKQNSIRTMSTGTQVRCRVTVTGPIRIDQEQLPRQSTGGSHVAHQKSCFEGTETDQKAKSQNRAVAEYHFAENKRRGKEEAGKTDKVHIEKYHRHHEGGHQSVEFKATQTLHGLAT